MGGKGEEGKVLQHCLLLPLFALSPSLPFPLLLSRGIPMGARNTNVTPGDAKDCLKEGKGKRERRREGRKVAGEREKEEEGG